MIPELNEKQNAVLKSTIAQASSLLKVHDMIMPVVFLMDHDDKISIVAGNFGGTTTPEMLDSKDAFAIGTRKIAAKHEAIFSIFIAESWSLRDKDANEYLANRQNYPNGIQDHPNRIDILVVQVELLGNHWATSLEIVDRKIVTPVKFERAENASGRFSSFLPRRGPR